MCRCFSLQMITSDVGRYLVIRHRASFIESLLRSRAVDANVEHRHGDAIHAIELHLMLWCECCSPHRGPKREQAHPVCIALGCTDRGRRQVGPVGAVAFLSFLRRCAACIPVGAKWLHPSIIWFFPLSQRSISHRALSCFSFGESLGRTQHTPHLHLHAR